MDAFGRPSFKALQNYASAQRDLLLRLRSADSPMPGSSLKAAHRTAASCCGPKCFLVRQSRSVTRQPSTGKLSDLIASVRQQKLEGLIAKRTDSAYESGERSSAWLKMPLNG